MALLFYQKGFLDGCAVFSLPRACHALLRYAHGPSEWKYGNPPAHAAGRLSFVTLIRRLFKKSCSRAGFTLIEILIILVVLSIMMGLLLPRLYVDNNLTARREAVRFVNILQQLTEQASFDGVNRQIRLNLVRQRYTCLKLQGREYKIIASPALSGHDVDRQRLRLIVRHLDDGYFSSMVKITITPFGLLRPLLLNFKERDRSKGYSVLFIPGQRGPRLTAKLANWSDIKKDGNF